MDSASVLGVIAGGGALPRQIVDQALQEGRPVFVLAFPGHTDDATVDGVPHAWVRLGAAGTALDRLKAAGARDLVLAGRIRRPSLVELRPDWRAARLMARAGIAALGDDGLLSAVVRELEGEGFRLLAVPDVLDDALAPAGVWGSYEPDAQARADIERAAAVVVALGRADVGQAAVVQGGLVLAVEAIEGTDRMIQRAGALQREGPGGVLIKLAKPGQERRADLPTVGPATVEAIATAGLRGLAVETDATLAIARDEMIRRADAAGVFLVGIDVAGPQR